VDRSPLSILMKNRPLRMWLPLLLLLLTLLVIGPIPSLQGQVAPVKQSITLTPHADVDPYRPHIPSRAITYQRILRILGLASLFWNLAGLFLLLRTGLSSRLRLAVYRVFRLAVSKGHRAPPFRIVALYYLLYALLLMVWMLPFGLAGFAIEHQYGFSRQSVPAYLRDVLDTTLIGCAIIPLLWAAFRVYARSPRHWWRWMWLLLAPVLFCVIVLQPVLVAPHFNSYKSLPAGPLRERILSLASRAGIRNGNIFIEDTSRRTSHVNAYVTGLGPSTRIVIDDTALQQIPEDQLMAMLGHEIGHYVEGHIWIGSVSAALGLGIFFWAAARLLPLAIRRWHRKWGFRSLTDVAAIPLMMLFVSLFLLAQDPFQNAESRYLEHRADAFGLRLTHLNDATARLFVGFAERDFSDPDPPPLLHLWFGSHPTLADRIAFAREYRP
jgi:STE24 endopeptidase